MNIFVTGGTGFIGTPVVNQLVKDGHEVLLLCIEEEPLPLTLDSKKIHVIRGNLDRLDSWETIVTKFEPQAALHMAWEAIPTYDYKTSTKNLIYGLNLIKQLTEMGCKKILCTGSCWEYGKKTGKLTEEMVAKPTNAFTAAKHSLYLMGKEIAKENNAEFIWTRLFYVYGPGQKSHSLIPHIIDSIRSGKELDIKTPHTKNDFVYVEDVAHAITLLLSKKVRWDLYNIGSGSSTEIIDVINMVYELYGMKKRYNPPKRASSTDVPVDFWADISRVTADVGWTPQYSIYEGIKKTVQAQKLS
jgi:nucleoside-diphosphate-sugar epimerase